MIEKNGNGKTPFVIAIENGSLKCIKYILGSKWLHRNVDIGDLINADSLKTTIDTDQLEIASFFVSDTRRFAAIIQIQIDFHSRLYNVLEYSIALKKSDFVRTFISVKIPPEERETYRNYKNFLKRYNISYPSSTFDQTPIQRMLTSVCFLFFCQLNEKFSFRQKWFRWFRCFSNSSSAKTESICPCSTIV